MAQIKAPDFPDDENVEADFRFKTFKEMADAFGRRRAASLLVKARRQRQAATKGPEVGLEDIRVTRVFLGFTQAEPGVKYGPLSGKALRVFKAFVASDPSAKASVKRFLDKAEAKLP